MSRFCLVPLYSARMTHPRYWAAEGAAATMTGLVGGLIAEARTQERTSFFHEVAAQRPLAEWITQRRFKHS